VREHQSPEAFHRPLQVQHQLRLPATRIRRRPKPIRGPRLLMRNRPRDPPRPRNIQAMDSQVRNRNEPMVLRVPARPTTARRGPPPAAGGRGHFCQPQKVVAIG
jgi:hypothetical protein